MQTEKQARNQLGTPGSAKSLRGAQIFELSPIFSNYIQHIFPEGGEKFSRGSNYGPAENVMKRLLKRLPGYGPAEKYYATTTPATGSLLDAR